MNQQFPTQVFDEAQKLFKDALKPGGFQEYAERSVATSKAYYDGAVTAALEGARALTEVGDTAWASTKLLNEKAAQNLAANVGTAFAAAQKLVSAKSLAEAGKIQAEYVQEITNRVSEQTREIVDLSTRTAQHILEKAQAAVKAIKPAS